MSFFSHEGVCTDAVYTPIGGHRLECCVLSRGCVFPTSRPAGPTLRSVRHANIACAIPSDLRGGRAGNYQHPSGCTLCSGELRLATAIARCAPGSSDIADGRASDNSLFRGGSGANLGGLYGSHGLVRLELSDTLALVHRRENLGNALTSMRGLPTTEGHNPRPRAETEADADIHCTNRCVRSGRVDSTSHASGGAVISRTRIQQATAEGQC